MRKSLLVAAIVSALLVAGAAQTPASERTSAPAPSAFVETMSGTAIETSLPTPLILAQYSSDNSSSSSVRIPRGAIKLVIFAVVAVVSFLGWAARKAFS